MMLEFLMVVLAVWLTKNCVEFFSLVMDMKDFQHEMEAHT